MILNHKDHRMEKGMVEDFLIKFTADIILITSNINGMATIAPLIANKSLMKDLDNFLHLRLIY